jgi:hypothetical protein
MPEGVFTGKIDIERLRSAINLRQDDPKKIALSKIFWHYGNFQTDKQEILIDN